MRVVCRRELDRALLARQGLLPDEPLTRAELAAGLGPRERLLGLIALGEPHRLRFDPPL